jgi:hypothetical protein
MNPHEKIHNPEDLPRAVIDLHVLLKSHNIQYAFGGAIATKFYTERQPTKDIDVNIFIPLKQRAVNDIETVVPVLKIIDPALTAEDAQKHLENIRQHDDTAMRFQDTRVDLFFSYSDLHDEAAGRIKYVEHQGAELPILSAEDLIIIKIIWGVLANRQEHDWADIEGILRDQAGKLDARYIYKWLDLILEKYEHKDQIFDRLAGADLPNPYKDANNN